MYVSSSNVSVMWLQLPPEDVKDFLEQMSVPRLNRGWEFLLPTDHDFVRKHPDVAQRQHMLWLGIQSKYDIKPLFSLFYETQKDLLSEFWSSKKKNRTLYRVTTFWTNALVKEDK